MFNYNKVNLVCYSKIDDKSILDEKEYKDLLSLIAYCARVSNPNNQHNTATSDKLINYLLKHKHFSPFEMVSITLEIITTRDIARQILRHRSFSFQEFSQRYAEVDNNSFVIRDTRLQDKTNRQNSIDIDDNHSELENTWIDVQKQVIKTAKEAYQWAIENGIAKEQARAVLPEGNTLSRLYMAGSLRSWIHYIDVRDGNGTQKEHIDIAKKVANEISKVFPLIVPTT